MNWDDAPWHDIWAEGRERVAIAGARRHLASWPDDQTAWRDLTNWLVHTGATVEALSALDQCIRLADQPSASSAGHFYKASILRDLCSFGEAELAVEASLAAGANLDPESQASRHDLLASVRFRSGKEALALESASRAVNLAPANKDWLYNWTVYARRTMPRRSRELLLRLRSSGFERRTLLAEIALRDFLLEGPEPALRRLEGSQCTRNPVLAAYFAYFHMRSGDASNALARLDECGRVGTHHGVGLWVGTRVAGSGSRRWLDAWSEMLATDAEATWETLLWLYTVGLRDVAAEAARTWQTHVAARSFSAWVTASLGIRAP